MSLRKPSPMPATAGLLFALLLTGCAAEGPFVATDYRYHQRATVAVCYNDEISTAEQAQAMAEEICRQYDRTAKLQLVQLYQCSWTAPTRATYNCVARPGEHPAPITRTNAPMRHDTPLPPE